MRLVLRLLLACCFAIALARAGAFLVYAAYQVVSPVAAYHLEGKMTLLAWRAQAGEPLYPDWRDGPTHVANFFGPLYFLAVGAIGRLLDLNPEGLTLAGRLLTVGSALAAAALAGLASGRREGTTAGLFAGVTALGAAPMVGFSVMVRPDTMADLLGFAGFLLAVGRGSRWRGHLGTALLVAAVFTKQTAGLYAAAAVLALVVDSRRRTAAVLAATVGAASAAIVTAVTMTIEPRFAADLLGEAGSPSSVENWRYILWRLWASGRDGPILAAVGFGLWAVRSRRDLPMLLPWLAILGALAASLAMSFRDRSPLALGVAALPVAAIGLWAAIDPGRGRDRPLATLAVVQLVGSAAAALKLGSDLNYFLGLRLVAALGAGAAWGAVLRLGPAQGGGRPPILRGAAVSLALVGLGYGMLASLSHAIEQMNHARRLVRYIQGPGQALQAQREQLLRLASDPDVSILSDYDQIQLYLRDRAQFGDPWLFRVMVEGGRIDPAAIRRRLEAGSFDFLISERDLIDVSSYDSYDFRLPRTLAEAARRRYRFAGTAGGLYVYEPIPLPGAPPGDRDG